MNERFPSTAAWLHAVGRTLLFAAGIIPLAALSNGLGRVGTRLDMGRTVARIWAERGLFSPGVMALLGLRIEVAGVENVTPGEPLLYVSNHGGYLDPMNLSVALPGSLTFMMLAQLEKVPFFGAHVVRSGHIPVKKGESADAIQAMIARLRMGDSMGIFPEGGRSKDGSIRPFEPGFIKIAREAGVRMIPVAIHGSWEAHHGREKLVRPGTIRVQLGAPITLEELSSPQEEMRARILDLKAMAEAGGPRFRRGPGIITGALRCWERHYPASAKAAPLLRHDLNKPRSIAFFDVDHCVTEEATGIRGARLLFAAGMVPARTIFGALAFNVQYAAGKADGGVMWKAAHRVLRGLSDERIRSIAREYMAGAGLSRVREGALALIRHHQVRGDEVVFISGGPKPLVEALATALDVRHVLCAWPVLAADGTLTDELDSVIAYGEGKGVLMREFAAARGVDLAGCWAYSDSTSDLAMLEAVGRPVVISPGARMRRVATARGWPVLQLVDLLGSCAAQIVEETRVRPAELAAGSAGDGAGLDQVHAVDLHPVRAQGGADL